MNRLLLIASVSAAVGLAGCHKTGDNAGKDLENPGQSAPVNTVQDRRRQHHRRVRHRRCDR